MHSYELAAFQWSVHKIKSPGAQIEHTAWLNTDDVFPNFEFARRLKDQIGESGTIYIWSPFEIVVLSEIRRQLDQSGVGDSELAGWLDGLTDPHSPRVVDLCALAKNHYFHPVMKGSLSIKDVLRATWGQNEWLREANIFSRYLKVENVRH
jgi:hypothetical protein